MFKLSKKLMNLLDGWKRCKQWKIKLCLLVYIPLRLFMYLGVDLLGGLKIHSFYS